MANVQVAGTVSYIIDADDSKLRSGLNSAKQQVGQFSDALNRSTAQGSAGFEGLGSTITKVLAAVAIEETARRFTSFGIQSASALQSTSTSMQLLVGDTAEANKVFGDLYKFSQGTPFAFPDVAAAAKTLLQYGISANDVVGVTQNLGNVVAVTGTNFQSLAQVYGEVNAAGKVQMDQIQQLTQNGVPILQALSQVTGKSFAELSDAFQRGGVSAKAFNAAIQQIAPADALEAMANTLPTRLSALQGSLRSLAFAFLGIKIDPIRGFVVEAGGLFDQFSNGVASLARNLRGAGIQEAMREFGSIIGAVASTGIPLLLSGVQAIGSNLNIIIPVVAGLGGAILALNFAQAIPGMVAFFATLLAGGITIAPLTIGIVLLGAALGILAGSVLIDAAKSLSGLGSAAKGASNAVNDAASTNKKAASTMGQVVQLTDQQRQQLADIAANIGRANRDFDQSLADILKSSNDKIKDLKASIADEADSFANAQAKRTAAFNKAQAEQDKTHTESVDDIQKNIDQEIAKGRFGDLNRLSDLRDRLDKENREYQQSTSDKLASYQEDTANAQAEHDKKTSGLQAQLNEETAFQQKHAADLQGIRAADALDQIDKLKQSHTDQLNALEQQRQRLVAQAAQAGFDTTAAQASGAKGAAGQFAGVGTAIANSMGDAIKSALKSKIAGYIQDFKDLFEEIGKSFQIVAHYIPDLLNPFKTNEALAKIVLTIGQYLSTGKVQYRATGGPVSAGSPYVVGDGGEPELFVPNQSGTIIAFSKLGGGGGNTFNVTNNNYNVGDVDASYSRMLWMARYAA